MLVLGLTGSIGMGKTATAKMFAEAGVPVHDADATVHALYRGAAIPLIEAAFPGTTDASGVDRKKLANFVIGNESAMQRLEAIIHPLVRRAEAEFLRSAAESNRMALLDIPLLLETGGNTRVDAVIVVTADAKTQRDRVLGRKDMTADKFTALLENQMPDREKRARAHFLVDSSHGFSAARDQVRDILSAVAVMRGRFV